MEMQNYTLPGPEKTTEVRLVGRFIPSISFNVRLTEKCRILSVNCLEPL